MVEDEFRTIDRYETIELLGRGGMGSVYLARDPLIDRYVAVKVLDGAFEASARERFTREARASGRLHHPNIVTIFDVGEHQGRPFIAMEYVPGQTLAVLIRRGQLGPAEKLRLVADACLGLAYAHRAGIIHLDVKPENLVRHDNGVLKILDFGIARVLAGETTHTQHVHGTLRYMAPEQAGGQPVDRRTDVFALGCVLYEVIAGTPAFKGTMPELLSRVASPIAVAPLSDLAPGVHPKLVQMVQRAMANDPSDRYDDVEVMRRELDGLRRQLYSDNGETTRVIFDSNAAASHAGSAVTASIAATVGWTAALTEPAALTAPASTDDEESVSTPENPSDRRSMTGVALAVGLLAAGAILLSLFRADAPTPVTSAAGSNPVSTTSQASAGTATALAGEVPASQPSNGNRAQETPRAGGPQSEGVPGPVVARGDVAAVAPSVSPRASEDSGPSAIGKAPDSLSAPGAARAASRTDAGDLAPAQPLTPTAPRDVSLSGSDEVSPQGAGVRPPETAANAPVAVKRPASEPAPADAPAPDAAIRAVLKKYEAAYDDRDATALRRIVPTLSAEQLAAVSRTFADAVSYDVDVQLLALNISGSTATATCLVTHLFVPRIGSASRNPSIETRFHLRQAADGWVIERIERTAKP